MTATDILNFFTSRTIRVRLVNLRLAPSASPTDPPRYEPSFAVTLSKDGVDVAHFTNASFEAVMHDAYDWATSNGLLTDRPVFTDVCSNCMRRIIGKSLMPICATPDDEYRNLSWHKGCGYKIWFAMYGESHWQTWLNPAQIEEARRLDAEWDKQHPSTL